MQIKTVPIDWARLCLNLGMVKPLAQIARETGHDEQTINRLRRGDVVEPRFSVGIDLLNYHFDICGIEKHKKLLMD